MLHFIKYLMRGVLNYMADSRRTPSQWETSLQSNAVSLWQGAILESALKYTNDISTCVTSRCRDAV